MPDTPSPSIPPSRVGKRALTVHLDEQLVRRLQLFSVLSRTSQQDLVAGALGAFLDQQRAPPAPDDSSVTGGEGA